MRELNNITDQKGKVAFGQLCELVSECSLADFTAQCKHPFLVGKELLDGIMRVKDARVSRMGTMKFFSYELRNELQKQADTKNINLPPQQAQPSTRTEAISKSELNITKKNAIEFAVFTLKKKYFQSGSEDSLFTIGRIDDNDVVINDYAVSKHHAMLHFLDGIYNIKDMNSTNGIFLDGKRMPPDSEAKLPYNTVITFGRINFVFMHPLQLYRQVRKEILNLQ